MPATGSKMHGDPCRAATMPATIAGLANNGPTDNPLISGEQIANWSHPDTNQGACDGR